MNNIPSMPQLGIYVSKIDPTLRITVTDVILLMTMMSLLMMNCFI